MSDFRVVFMGTPDFAVGTLDALVQAGINIVAVVTTPDKPAGRGRKINESAVKQYAKQLNIPILQPEKLRNPEFIAQLQALNAQLNVVVAFRMLPQEVWAMPPMGTINLHGSLLPQYRGAAPINWAIINGDKKTGVTTFFIDKQIDTGDIIDKAEIEIGSNDNVGSMHDKLMLLGATLLTQTVQTIASGKAVRTKQNLYFGSEADLRHAPKIFKDDCKINWHLGIDQLHNFIRGLSPYPAAWTSWSKTNGEALSLKVLGTQKETATHNLPAGTISTDNKKYLKVAVQGGYIDITELQLQGKKRMKTDDFLRGIKMEQFSTHFQ